MQHDPRIQEEKADFSKIYDRPDPRAYFRTLGALDYQIPQQALPVFDAVIDALPERDGTNTIVDVCCSYGINAALLRHDVDITGLTSHYTDTTLVAASPGELLEVDQQYYGSQPARRTDVEVVGLDAAQPAIDYAVEAGLLADGWAEDLESEDPSAELAKGVGDANLIISTGGVGYVGRPTFERLINCLERPNDLWLTTFVLRVFDYSEISDLLAEYGLVTEQVPDVTFPQRRFASEDEKQAAISDVRARGLDPDGKEADGWFHAGCFVSRPAAVAEAIPLDELLADALV